MTKLLMKDQEILNNNSIEILMNILDLNPLKDIQHLMPNSHLSQELQSNLLQEEEILQNQIFQTTLETY